MTSTSSGTESISAGVGAPQHCRPDPLQFASDRGCVSARALQGALIETISGLTDGNEDQNHNRTLKWISCPQFGKQREIAVPGEQRIDAVCNAESGYSGIVNNAADHMRA